MKILHKAAPIRLNHDAYRKLRRHILGRDGWRCQLCGSMEQLQVHHLKFRSQSGGDVEENLITLCGGCHAYAHRRR
jgi:5-methylcytosine-specific restriction endonuclease McrA